MGAAKTMHSVGYRVAQELLEKLIVTVFTLIFLSVVVGKFVMGQVICTKKKGRLSESVRTRFKKLPGLPIVGALHHLHLHKKDTGRLFETWRKTYGLCWRTKICGRNVLFIHDPALLKPLLESSDPGHLAKFPFLYNILFVGAARNGLVSMPVSAWQPHRKAMNSLFTYEALKNYVPTFCKYGDQLVKEIGENLRKSSYHEIVHVKTLDIICEIAIGQPMETVLGRLGCVEFYENLNAIQIIMSEKLFAKPWILIPSIWRFSDMRNELYASVSAIEDAVAKIRKYHVPSEKTRYALDMMIQENWSHEEVKAELVTLVATGHETISRTLNTHLWMMALEQKHQLACQQEIDLLFDALETSGRQLSLADLSNLKYLERSIKETLRIYSSTPFGTGRELRSPLKLSNDLTLEPGTIVMFSTYVLHRDPKSFPDPDVFNPDRFLPENVKQRHVYSYLPFSAGVRNCAGWRMGLIELTVLSAKILREFHLTTPDMRKDIQMMFSSTLYPSKEPRITFRRRR